MSVILYRAVGLSSVLFWFHSTEGGVVLATASTGGKVLVLGTGGTIAGTSSTGRDRDYQAAQLQVADLVQAVPELAAYELETQQVAQVDSKDMGWPVWKVLLAACHNALARHDVTGLVITHGTDTLEETALLLHVLLPPGKPVVLTAAMRPATSEQADGPLNLWHSVRAVEEATRQGWHGVVVAMNGQLWPATLVRKSHSWHVDAFDGGGLAANTLNAETVWQPCLGMLRPHLMTLPALPWVALAFSHADADGRLIEAALSVSEPPEGWVVACTGHGTWHAGLRGALLRAEQGGALVWRSTRVARGGVSPEASGTMAVAGVLTPAQARLMMSVGLALGGAAGAEGLRDQIVQSAIPLGLMA
jgi:L-asparaginase